MSEDIRDQIRRSGMTIIGITGRKGSGKSTMAEYLGKNHPFHVRLAFADPLRSLALTIFGSEYKSQDEKAATDAFWSERLGEKWSTGRKILQRLGTEIGREQIHEDVWLFVMERRLLALSGKISGDHPKPLVTIEDCRFPNECAFVHEIGGTIIRMINTNLPPNTDTHASEAGVSTEFVDHEYEIGTAEDVRRIATAYAVCSGLAPKL